MRGSAQLPMTPVVLINDMNVMNSEAPSSAPRTGRNESERNSKKLSSQANLPRGPAARAAALTSSAPPPALAISGRAWISVYAVWTAPPMMIWNRLPA